jgi:hypothetical protein
MSRLLSAGRLLARLIGWFLIGLGAANKVVQMVSSLDFLRGLLTPAAAGFLNEWGWLMLLMLGALIVWRVDTARAREAATVRDFRAAALDWARAVMELSQQLPPKAELTDDRVLRRTHALVGVLFRALPKRQEAAMKAAYKEAALDRLREMIRDAELVDDDDRS